jgi:hypothetical protein
MRLCGGRALKLRNNSVTDAGAALLSQLLQRDHHFAFDTLDLGGSLIGSAGTFVTQLCNCA